MVRCARCDFTATDAVSGRLELANHAKDSTHLLCVVCARSLRLDEIQTCERCLTDSRGILSGVLTMWCELPRHLGHVRGARYDEDRPGVTDGRPLPGGDVLVLASPGGMGFAEDAMTWRQGDAPSVAQVLAQWEDDWRHTRGESAAVVNGGRGGVSATVRCAAGYLDVHTRWAAREHPAFDEYTEDLRSLHMRLERVTGRADAPRKAEAECFSCGGMLLREVRPGKPCSHDLASLPPHPNASYVVGGEVFYVPVQTLRAEHERAITKWETDHGRCQQQGGYADSWTCRRCGGTYDWERYTLALRARLADRPESGWSLPQHVAWLLGIPLRTVRSWADRGQVATACLVGDRRMRVSYDEVRALAEVADARRAAAEERATRRVERTAVVPHVKVPAKVSRCLS